MRYYRRYSTDGRCVIICTRCFATIGSAAVNAVASELERQHVCGPRVAGKFDETALRTYADFRPTRGGDRLLVLLRRSRGWSAALLFVAIALAVYALPNLVESTALRYTSPWVANIVFGDLIGCLCLALVLRMPRTGAILYLALAVVEGGMYATGAVSPGTLVWLTDAVPTLVVVARVAQLRESPAMPPSAV